MAIPVDPRSLAYLTLTVLLPSPWAFYLMHIMVAAKHWVHLKEVMGSSALVQTGLYLWAPPDDVVRYGDVRPLNDDRTEVYIYRLRGTGKQRTGSGNGLRDLALCEWPLSTFIYKCFLFS